ncbi:MAG: hypothetical protein MRY72_13730, partial [Aquisalinus sp.]|nr:hypothetical protein [Aquisalinus sp.]
VWLLSSVTTGQRHARTDAYRVRGREQFSKSWQILLRPKDRVSERRAYPELVEGCNLHILGR